MSSPTELAREVARRRTFAIISHPDAGKTTLTEHLLLLGGAVREPATPVQDPEGRVVGVVETALDITARKQAEEALRQSEERFRAIFDHVSVGMALVDANGCVLMANDADCRFLGYPREELVGLHFSVFTHPDDMAIDAELYESLVKGERESYDIDKRYIRKDGDIVWGRLSVSLVRDEQGQPQYTVIACEDVTEQRLAAEALKRSQRHLKAILDNIPDLAWLSTSPRKPSSKS